MQRRSRAWLYVCGALLALMPMAALAATGGIQSLPAPVRLADTRVTGGSLASGATRCFAVAGQAGIPADAAAVVLNVTAVNQTTNGWLTVYPTGQPVPATSTLNFATTEYAIANNTIMALGTGGQVCVSVGTVNSAPGSVQVILDATGFLIASNDVALLPAPVRLGDTRSGGVIGTNGGPIQAGGPPGCFNTAFAPALATLVLNVTAVGYSTNGWLTLFPNGTPAQSTSTVNFDRAEYAIANGALVRNGDNGLVCVSVGTINGVPGSSHVVVDAIGYLTGTVPSTRNPVMLSVPQRLADTRLTGGPVTTGSSRCFPAAGQAGVPATATGVALNVTAVGYNTNGWLTAYPAGQGVPATSTLNFDVSESAIANGAILPLGSNGQVCVGVGTINALPGSSHIVLDVVGYLP